MEAQARLGSSAQSLGGTKREGAIDTTEESKRVRVEENRGKRMCQLKLQDQDLIPQIQRSGLRRQMGRSQAVELRA
eukprot:1273651-Amphidinium_carterae.1